MPTIAAPCFLSKSTITNIVGYNANDTVVAVNKNFVMLAPSFLNVTKGTISSDELTCDQTTTSYDEAAGDFFPGWDTDAACLQVPDGFGSYSLRYYIDDADDGKGNFVTGWADSTAMLNTAIVPAGSGFWIRRCSKDGASQAWSFTVEL